MFFVRDSLDKFFEPPPLKISLAHPGTGAFVQQTARALFEADLLAGYWTTFADQPDASWRRALVSFARLFGLNLEREFERRAISEVPIELLRCAPFWEVLRTLAARLQLDPRLVDLIWEKEVLSFDARVATFALEGVDGIYGYEFSALASFQAAKRRGLACIYEVPSAEHEYAEGVIQHEIQRFPELDLGARKFFVDRQAARTARRREEWELADVVVVNSIFTRRSYERAGLDTDKVCVVPLGAPPIVETSGSLVLAPGNKLKVLWAGTFSAAKGAHYLLAAWREIAGDDTAMLQVFGSNRIPANLTADLPGHVTFSPTVPRKVLFQHYLTSDVLVFPTLCDGFGMVVTEAFSHGLPVITTPRAGAAELVRHGENGLIVPPADSIALADALRWCLAHRAELRAMRALALETAKHWQWSDFRRELKDKVLGGLLTAGYAV